MAQIGLGMAVISDSLYGVVLIMVVVAAKVATPRKTLMRRPATR